MASKPSATLTLAQARKIWHRRQGLDAPGAGLEETLAATGPVRALGGADVYLSAAVRVEGLTPQDLDAAAARRDVQVIPAARGCMYLVPRVDVPLMLGVAHSLWARRNELDLEKVSCSPQEFQAVQDAVVATLADGAMTPTALRKALPDGVLRSFGPAGKKVGLSSALPPALRALEFAGLVERAHEDGRLDSERYVWRVASAPLPPTPEDLHAALADRFFGFAAPATRDDFAAWSGVGKGACQAAIDKCDLVPVEIDGYAKLAWLPPGDLERLDEPASTAIHLLSFHDNYITNHGGPGPISAPDHHELPCRQWGPKKHVPLGTVKHIFHRPILSGPELVGFWDFHPDDRDVVWTTLAAPSPALADAINDAAARTGSFLRDEVGHGRSYPMDTDDAIRSRIDWLRSL